MAITFSTETAVMLFDDYVDNLNNELRHFLYLNGPSEAYFKNFTIKNAYSMLFYFLTNVI